MKVLFTGDINFRLQNITRETAQQKLRFVKPYLDMADVRIANLETPLAKKELHSPIVKSGPNLICDPSCIEFLTTAGFDAVTIANNHMGDYGEQALMDTIALLDQHGIKHTGAGKTLDEAYQAYHIERSGATVSVLAVCENEFGIAAEQKAGTAGINLLKIAQQIKQEKEHSEFVVIVPHGGNEHNPLPSPGTVTRYRLFCELGADAVVATHTHCPQGYEIYDGKPIVYSMGNFFFRSADGKPQSSPWHYGYMTMLAFQQKGRVGIEVIPYRFDPEATYITPFDGESRDKMLAYLGSISEIVHNPQLLRLYYKGWCYLHPWLPQVPKDVACWDAFVGKVSDDKNLYGCEAHNEQATEILRIINDGELEEAKLWATKIVALQEMPF